MYKRQRLPYNRRMARDRQLILNRYRPIGEAKAGGFGTVRVAWDTRIQRKVAIKCIELDEVDAARAALPGANAVAQRAPQHEPLPWEDDPVFNDADEAEGDATSVFDLVGDGPLVHSLAHVPGSVSYTHLDVYKRQVRPRRRCSASYPCR